VPVSQVAVASLEHSEERPQVQRRSNPKLYWAMAAALAVMTLGVWLFAGPEAWRTYSTKIGEQRTIALSDGSVVHLNTDSAVTVRMNDGSRRIRLVRGEALFSVVHDASRPFLVQSGNALIQALGTRFDVYRRASGTRVAVLEGLVQISDSGGSQREPARVNAGPTDSPIGTATLHEHKQDGAQLLSAGQAAEVSSRGELSHREAVDAAKTVAWRQRRLVFEEDSLGDIAAEFNRYNPNAKIVIVGAAARSLHFSGTFDADRPEAIVQALEVDPTLLIERTGNEIVIQERQ
jgi:transmembrane sensor